MLKGFILKITYILLSLILPFLPNSIQEEVMTQREFREIENITSPQQVIWRDDNRILFVLESNLLEYNIVEDTLLDIGERKPNQFVGISKDDEIILCDIEHYMISSHDEFSTKFKVEIPKEKKKELYFFETIRPVYINEERIIAITALDFLEKNYYRIDIESGEKKQITPLKKVKRRILIPKEVQFKKAYIRNKDRYVVEDIFGNIYLVTREKLL